MMTCIFLCGVFLCWRIAFFWCGGEGFVVFQCAGGWLEFFRCCDGCIFSVCWWVCGWYSFGVVVVVQQFLTLDARRLKRESLQIFDRWS